MIKLRKMRWALDVGRMGQAINSHKPFVEKPEGKKLLARNVCIWGDNIKIYLKTVRYHVVDWIHLAQNIIQKWEILNTVINLWILRKARNTLTS
jgi:hypothetical protein